MCKLDLSRNFGSLLRHQLSWIGVYLGLDTVFNFQARSADNGGDGEGMLHRTGRVHDLFEEIAGEILAIVVDQVVIRPHVGNGFLGW